MAVTLKTNQLKLKLPNGNYQAPVIIADKTTSEHITEVNTAITSQGEAQLAAIQSKGTEVLNSIPADYTDLTEDVADVKSAIDFAIDVKIINDFTNGYFYSTSSGSINYSSPISDPTLCTKIFECKSGDRFKITGTGGNSARLYAFGNDSGTIISRSDANISKENFVIVCPEEATHLIVNFKINDKHNVVISGLVPNIEKKIADYVMPWMFGAIGDGVADDLQALEEMFAYGKNIIFEKGKTYKISEKIEISNVNNMHIYGNSSVIKLDKGTYETLEEINTGIIEFYNCSNISIENLKVMTTLGWMVRPDHSSENFQTYINNRNKCYIGILCRNCERISIKQVETSYIKCGIFFADVTNSIIDNSYIHHTYADGVFISGASSHIDVTNCFASNVNDDCYSADGYGEGINYNPSYINFVNCTVWDCVGALVCLEGSYYSTALNCKGYRLKLKPLKLGILTDGDNNAPGDYQTIDNCYIDISSEYYSGDTCDVITVNDVNVHATITNSIIRNRYTPIEFRFYDSDTIISANRFSNIGLRFVRSQALIETNVLNLRGGIHAVNGYKTVKISNNIINIQKTTKNWYVGGDFVIGDSNIEILNNRIVSENTDKGLILFAASARLISDYGYFNRSAANYYKITYKGVFDLDTYDVLLSNFVDGQFVKKNNAVSVVWNGQLI